MDNNEITILKEKLKELLSDSERKPKMDFCKKLTIIALLFFAVSGAASFASWVVLGDWPRDIILHFSVPFAAVVSCYLCKDGYESKAKIEKGDM